MVANQTRRASFFLQASCDEGEMAEWSIAAVLKTVELRGSGGSNPSLSAKKNLQGIKFQPCRFFLCLKKCTKNAPPPFLRTSILYIITILYIIYNIYNIIRCRCFSKSNISDNSHPIRLLCLTAEMLGAFFLPFPIKNAPKKGRTLQMESAPIFISSKQLSDTYRFLITNSKLIFLWHLLHLLLSHLYITFVFYLVVLRSTVSLVSHTL